MMALAIAAFTFTACEDVPEPYLTPTPSNGNTPQKEAIASGDGTLENPFNAVAATKAAKALGSGNVSEQMYYIKGKVVSIATKDGTPLNFDQGTYGNASFYISDDGTSTNQFYCYRVLYLGNKKWSQGSGDILKVGDDVIVCAKLTMFNTTPETQQNEGFLYSLNGVTNGGGQDPAPSTDLGTADAPLTVAKALELINGYKDGGSSSADAYVKGKIVSVQSYNSQYKSITYYISDDGTENGQLQVYSGKGLNGADFASQKDLNPGATVVVKGQLKKYVKDSKVTPEINQSSTIVSIEGNEGGNVEPDPQPTDNLGTADAPLTVAKALEIINSYEDAGYSPTDAYVKGKIVSVQSYNDKYKSITYWISDDGTENGQMQVYSGKGLNGADFASKDDLTVGATVIVKGELKKFVKNGAVTPEINQNNQIVYIEGNGGSNEQGGGGNEQGGNQGGEASGNSLTVVFGDLGLSELAAPVALSDGTTLTFAQEGGKNPPVYHSGTKIIRMYAQNSVTVNAGSKKIASVVFNYDTYNGTAYKGNEAMYGEAGTNKLTPVKDDATVTFNNVNASTLKVVNDFETNSGGTQFRITGVTINYAQ